MTAAARIPSLHTYADYGNWTEGRWELIDGEVFDMSPAPSRAHQEMVLALALALGPFFQGHPCSLEMSPFDVRLPEGDEADEAITTVVQPDLLVVCDEAKLDDRGCRGAPDWGIEVLSPSTATLRTAWRTRVLVGPSLRPPAHPLQEDGTFGPADIQEMRGTSTCGLFAYARSTRLFCHPKRNVFEPSVIHLTAKTSNIGSLPHD